MRRYLFCFFISILTFGYAGLTNNLAQDSKVPLDWKKVNICKMSFFVPKNLWNTNAKGIDSCVASFVGKKIRLELDYGWYTGPNTNLGCVDYKEEFIKIDEKTAQFATCRIASPNAPHNFSARIYVVLKEEPGATTSLAMFVATHQEKDLEIAKQIFQNIRFDK